MIAGFEEINARWACETIVSDNQFAFKLWEIFCAMG